MNCLCACFGARRRRRELRLGQVDRIVAESYAAGKLTLEGEVFLSGKPNLKAKASLLLVARHNAMSMAKILDKYVFVFETRLEELEREERALEAKCLKKADVVAIADDLGLHLLVPQLLEIYHQERAQKLHDLWKRVRKCEEFLAGTKKMREKREQRAARFEKEFEATIRAGL